MASSGNGSEGPERRASRALQVELLPSVSLCGFVLAAAFFRSMNPNFFNHDVAWFLYCSEQVLDGARLYVDIVDENPPLIIWLALPPVALAKLVGLPVFMVFTGFVVVAALLSAALCYAISSSRPAGNLAIPPLVLAGLVLCLELLHPGADFGQREHLLVIAIVPYLFAAAARAEGRHSSFPVALAVGTLAGVGIAIKPYFVLLWIAVEVVVFVRRRAAWRSLEGALVVAVNGVYVAAILLFAPEYLAVVAWALELLEAYRESGLAAVRWIVVAYVVVAAAVFVLSRRCRDQALPQVLLAATLALLLCALVQRASFSYRYLPAETLAFLLVSVVVLASLVRWRWVSAVLGRRVAAIPLAVLLMLNAWAGAALVDHAVRVVSPGARDRTVVRELLEIVSARASGKPIWFMSTMLSPAFPVVNLSGASWASRFCCVLIAPGVYTQEEKAVRPFPYHEMTTLSELEQWQFDSVIEDLEATPPELIVVDAGSSKQTFGETDFRFLAYFGRDPRFRRIFERYRLLTRVAQYRVYGLVEDARM